MRPQLAFIQEAKALCSLSHNLVESTANEERQAEEGEEVNYKAIGRRAHQIVQKAVREGKLPNLKKKRVKCVDCLRALATVYEHRDYANPLQVQPVCHRCNAKRGAAVISKEIDWKPKNRKIRWNEIDLDIWRNERERRMGRL